MQDLSEIYEKLNLFYLGKESDPNDGLLDELFLIKNKNLTTHATIIGMTGSGKTGLGIAILEEAILDNIPSIIIDPKGDMGNLLLTFPEFRPQDFLPWVDEEEATKKGLSKEEYAKKIAKTWEDGIKKWHQSKDRVKRLKEKSNITIYTPGSTIGVPISILSSFKAPPKEIINDFDSYTYMINSSVSSILALLGKEVDLINSKEAILLSNIFNHYWKKGIDLDLEKLIGAITSPPFSKIGVMSLKDFYPQNERLKLAFALNNIVASPTFSAWISGVEMDINKLLYTNDAKPKTAIFNISHLDDNQRMFFVTLFLNKFISWMRAQRGSSTLKTILYMDEIFGFFPASKNPPSKEPMLLLLKQARAFGVGIVLSTQNPIDLDYKGLSNIGSWFIGRLQTKQDIDRVIDGLSKAKGKFSKSTIRELLANLPKRTFLFKSAHQEDLVLFGTRWVMNYLKGPLNKNDIKLLTKEQKEKLLNQPENTPPKNESQKKVVDGFLETKPVVDEQIDEFFYITNIKEDPHKLRPYLLANATIHFFDQRRGIDQEEGVYHKYELSEDQRDINWDEFIFNDDDFELYEFEYPSNSLFAPLPEFAKDAKSFKKLKKEWIDYLYHNKRLKIYKAPKLKLESSPDESLEEFKIKVLDTLNELKDLEEEKLRKRFEKKEELLQKKLQRALLKLQKEEEDVKEKTTSTLLSFGMTILDAFLGTKRAKRSTIAKAGTALRGAGRIFDEKNDVKRAQQEVENIKKELLKLQDELEEEILKLEEKYDINNYEIKELFIKPRKSDISDIELAILWEDN